MRVEQHHINLFPQQGEDDEDEEQPAARCQFVGNQSNRSLGQSPDKSWREASSRSRTISRREEPVKEPGSLLQWVLFALLGVVLYFALVTDGGPRVVTGWTRSPGWSMVSTPGCLAYDQGAAEGATGRIKLWNLKKSCPE